MPRRARLPIRPTRVISDRIRSHTGSRARGRKTHAHDPDQSSGHRVDHGRCQSTPERSRSSVTALVVQPAPKFHGKNVIHIAQIANASASGGAIIQVNVNGQLDATQPAIGTIDRIIVFGGRTARNKIVVDPSVKARNHDRQRAWHGRLSYWRRRADPRTRMVRAHDVDRRSRPESVDRSRRQSEIQADQGDRPDLRRQTPPPHGTAPYVASGWNVLQVRPRSSRSDPGGAR